MLAGKALRRVAAALAVMVLGGSGSAAAATIAYDFTGTLQNSFGSLAAGLAVSGSFAYESGQPDQYVGPNVPPFSTIGRYDFTGFNLTIGGQTITAGPKNGLLVGDQASGSGFSDSFTINGDGVISGSLGGLTVDGLQFQLIDPTATVFGSDALPDSVDFADFSSATLLISSFTSGVLYRFISIETLTPAVLVSVPEPAGLGVALLGLAVLARRRR
jgi:MYXO-CTERM domain-containing protein